jgi:hypothetical protein
LFFLNLVVGVTPEQGVTITASGFMEHFNQALVRKLELKYQSHWPEKCLSHAATLAVKS